MTVEIRQLLSAGIEKLTAAGVPSPAHDARALLAHVCNVPMSFLVNGDNVSDQIAQAYRALISQRAQRIPLQHLVGSAGFRYLELDVGPGVFIPRPETELLVDWGLDMLNQHGPAVPLVVDLCAGSGAIALSIAREHQTAKVHAVEKDDTAYQWLLRNANSCAAGGDRLIATHHADATDPITLSILDGTVDLLLTNPPYLPSGTPLEAEVADHDPAAALWGGDDGLAVIRPLLERAAVLLRPGGWFGVEHADEHAPQVRRLLVDLGAWTDIQSHQDLAGRPRFCTAKRRS